MKVGEALLHYGIITRKQLHRALCIHAKTQRKLGEVLIELGYASERQVTACLAEQFGYEVIDPLPSMPSRESLEAVPVDFAVTNLVLPLEIAGDTLRCAINDPINLGITDALHQMTKCRVEIVLAERGPLHDAIVKAYANAGIHAASLPSIGPQPNKKQRLARKRHHDRWDREALLALAAQIPVPEAKRNWFGKRIG